MKRIKALAMQKMAKQTKLPFGMVNGEGEGLKESCIRLPTTLAQPGIYG